jgi:predicted dehydrogenase
MKKVRLAVIGCGGFVRWHLKTMVEEVKQFKCVGLVDTAAENAQRIIDQFGFKDAPVYSDHRAMLREVKPDAVIVSTPHTLHFRHCYDAISAGAHVMVEKPMVTDSSDARKLVKHARARKRVLQIAVQGTYTDTFAYARELIKDGSIGELQLVTGVMAQGWLEGTRGKWRQDPALSGGGQLYDSTSHVLSAMVFLIDSPVKETYCMADNKGVPVDINAVGVVKFANGCMATITSGGNCPSWKSHVIVQGSKAMMEISAHGGDFRVTGGSFKEPVTATPKGNGFRTVSPIRNFYDAIAGKSEPRCPGRLGIILADLMDGLYESVRTGVPAKVTRKLPKGD